MSISPSESFTPSKASQAQSKIAPSRSAVVQSSLDYPVIDTDLHTIEFAPLVEDYIDKIGGPTVVDQFRAAIVKGFGYLGNEWYNLSWEERRAQRSVRPPW